jgi:hypothetical protein
MIKVTVAACMLDKTMVTANFGSIPLTDAPFEMFEDQGIFWYEAAPG